MDSEHRHELKENDLAEFLHHFGQFWSKWGNSILLGLLIGLVVVFGVHHLRTRAAQKLERALSDLHLETTPAGLADVAARTDLVAVKAEAYLRAGEMLLTRAVMPDAPDATSPRTDEERKLDLDEAQTMLQRVVELPDVSPAFQFNAKLTLAAVAETRHEWDKAAEIYQGVKTDAAKDYPPLADRASMRLAMLDRLKQPVHLVPDPPKPVEVKPDAPVDLGQPATEGTAETEQPAPADTADTDADGS